jgi:hypothetical protein
LNTDFAKLCNQGELVGSGWPGLCRIGQDTFQKPDFSFIHVKFIAASLTKSTATALHAVNPAKLKSSQSIFDFKVIAGIFQQESFFFVQILIGLPPGYSFFFSGQSFVFLVSFPFYYGAVR